MEQISFESLETIGRVTHTHTHTHTNTFSGKIHCLFEQSGTFKNEFKKLGYEAIDYDIENKFNETDVQIDLFKEIENAYDEKESIFDNITNEDLIFAFFPCIRFENQIILCFKGINSGFKNWSLEKKLKYDMMLHTQLHDMYLYITKLVLIADKRNFKLIIENPYSQQHYLVRYWCFNSKIIDLDRTKDGDYYKKPTQYWFLNLEPSYNKIEDIDRKQEKKQVHIERGIKRSLISKEYANRFIRKYII